MGRTRWHACNVLKAGKDSRHLWQFQTAQNKVVLHKEETKLPNEALSPKLIAKDWDQLIQPKLNVAWLPPDEVFIRVVHLPKAELAETRSMVELQLEKLSPMPVAQVVWSFEIIPHPGGEMQSAIVIIVGRHHVEKFLGQLEALEFFADRLEMPVLDQLKEEYVQRNGAWIYPGWGVNPNACLAAWWQDGVLQGLSLVHLPADEKRAAAFQDQLRQMAWSGELEGWLKSPVEFHVVAEPGQEEAWVSMFEEGQMVDVVPPIPATELAMLAARRVTANGERTNLLPPDYASRYKQRFNDRLWMRGLGTVVAVYMIAVAIYFGWVEIAKWKLDTVADEVAALANSYTNVLQMKEKYGILKGQLDLQYAALDCWKAASDNLPTELSLSSLSFDRGLKVTFIGLAPGDGGPMVNDFNEALRNHKVGDRKLFESVDGARISENPATRQNTWSFACTLNRVDLK